MKSFSPERSAFSLRHAETGDVVSLPHPLEDGTSVVLFNGVVVETVTYSDVEIPRIRLGNGECFLDGKDFAEYLSKRLERGDYRLDSR